MKKEIERYLAWKASSKTRAATTYATVLRHFSEFMRKDIYDVRIDDVVRWQNLLKRRYAPANVAYHVIVLKNFVRFLKEDGKKVMSPWLIEVPKFVPNSHPAVTLVDLVKMDSVIREDTYQELRKKVILRLLWETGVRVTELCRLRMSDVNVREPSMVIRNEKNTGSRIVVWSDDTHRLLLSYIAARLVMDRNDWLFVSESHNRVSSTTGHLTSRSVERIVREIVVRAGLHLKYTPHSNRRGWAQLRLLLGCPLPVISRGMGHKSIESTAVYLQFEDKVQKETLREQFPHIEKKLKS